MALGNNPTPAELVKAVKDLEQGGGGGSTTDVQVDDVSQVVSGTANLKTINGDYNANTNKFVTANDISGKADDTSVVHKTGNESVSGTKNFTGTLFLKGKTLVDTLYPIGSLYLTFDNKILLAGNWICLGSGNAIWTTDTNAGLINREGNGGDIIVAGLPEIEGSFKVRGAATASHNTVASATGSFNIAQDTSTWGNSESTSSTSRVPDIVSFKASNSSNIYGNSNTVQPPAVKVYVWQRTFEDGVYQGATYWVDIEDDNVQDANFDVGSAWGKESWNKLYSENYDMTYDTRNNAFKLYSNGTLVDTLEYTG